MQRLEVTILAAGVGSRMHSNKPKVLQTLAGVTLLEYLLRTADSLKPEGIHLIVGHGSEMVRSAVAHRSDVNCVLQSEQLGTGHAMQQVMPFLQDTGRVLVLLGDCPLIEPSTLKNLCDTSADLALLTVEMNDPFGYGRIVRDSSGKVKAIVEEKDATSAEKQIREVNTGVMVADVELLKKWLHQLSDNNTQSEFLLTDIVEHANAGDSKVMACQTDYPLEVTGINNYVQLAELERALQKQQATDLMLQGVQIMDPNRLDIRGEVKAAQGVVIDINVILEGEVELGENVSIGPNCVIKDSIIEAGSEVRANTLIDGAFIGAGCIVGPFARLRPGAELADSVHIGNFVEVKKSRLGKGTKANHLAYVGDATIGAEVNVGAGAITCNYDGVNKHQTVIGDRTFIGTNSSLVAPLDIGAGSTVGAGSTITKDVDPDSLAVSRAKQVTVSNWQKPIQVSKKTSEDI